MIVIGIESTAHTFGIGIINSAKRNKVVANVKEAYTTGKGGIIPVEAAKHHNSVKNKVLDTALNEAGINLDDVDVVAYSRGPGLGPCLLEGLALAKSLAKKLKKPLVPVNHCIAHLEIARLFTPARNSNPVLLYTSGANTQVIAYAAGKYRIFGETLDMGVGNLIDNFARYIGLGFPGGPKIEQLAKKSNNFVELPYSVKGMDVSFSGLLTNLKQKYDKGLNVNDLAFSLQETAFAMLVEVAERAMAHLSINHITLGGGVACNSRLKEMVGKMAKQRKARFYCPPNSLLMDNGAMIAWLGHIMFKASNKNAIPVSKANIRPYERTDDVEVNWR